MERMIRLTGIALVGSCVVHVAVLCAAPRTSELRGGDLLVLGCKTCTMKKIEDLWECDHENTAAAPCSDTKCLTSYAIWWSCEPKTEIFDKARCETKTDAMIINRTQRVYQVTERLDCKDKGWEKIPGGQGTDCNQIGYGYADPSKQYLKGKCFLTAAEITRCKAGTIVEDLFFQGSEVCK